MNTRIYIITYSELTDAILARAALCGDITGRGHILVDNDGAALRAVMATLVPAALADLGIFAEAVETGWRLGPPDITKEQLTAYLTDLLLHKLTGTPDAPPELNTTPQTPASSITPWDM